MNFLVTLSADDCSIKTTGKATGDNVYGSLKVARAMLDDAVTAQIEALRTRRKIALKTPEAKLAVDGPVISAPAGAVGAP
jgi:hypothetical protein